MKKSGKRQQFIISHKLIVLKDHIVVHFLIEEGICLIFCSVYGAAMNTPKSTTMNEENRNSGARVCVAL